MLPHGQLRQKGGSLAPRGLITCQPEHSPRSKPLTFFDACVRQRGFATGLFAILVFLATMPGWSQNRQTVTHLDPGTAPPALGGGDSLQPVVSADGRYVAFASTARNLLPPVPGQAEAGSYPAVLNVFRRDLTNGTTLLLSPAANGEGWGNGDSVPVQISADGQLVLFESAASNLVPDDTNDVRDVFIRDLAAGTTRLVSVGLDGLPANGLSRSAAMTPDGRWVVFVSEASNLVAGDTNRLGDIFVRDTRDGVTIWASPDARARSYRDFSELPQISPDGTLVTFRTLATNLVAGVTAEGDIYARDLAAGTTTWVSAGARNALGTSNRVSCINQVLSRNGRHIVYQALQEVAPQARAVLHYDLVTGQTLTVSTNLWPPVLGFDPSGTLDISADGKWVAFIARLGNSSSYTSCVQLWDAETGQTTLVSGDAGGQVPTNTACFWVALGDSARQVAFLSTAQLTTNTCAGDYFLYVKDLQTGDLQVANVLSNNTCAALSPSSLPGTDAEVTRVAFAAWDGPLAALDRNLSWDIFLHEVDSGLVTPVSVRDPGSPSHTANDRSTFQPASLSAEGRYAAFTSAAADLGGYDTNLFPDVVLWDLCTGSNVLISVSTNGLPANGPSVDAAVSGDGRLIAFSSLGDNLVAGDTNKVQDVFLRDTQAGTTILVSRNQAGSGPGNAASGSPVLSQNGRYVVFRSKAFNLAPGLSSTSLENLFLRDLDLGTNWALTTSGTFGVRPVITPSGSFVVFGEAYPQGSSAGYLAIWDTATRTKSHASQPMLSPTDALCVTPDGNTVVFSLLGQLLGHDRLNGTNWTIATSSGVQWGWPVLRISDDGRWVGAVKAVFTTSKPTRKQIWLYDLQGAPPVLVSASFNGNPEIGGDSDALEMSADGRFLVYRSSGTNLVPGDLNGQPDVFLFDRATMKNHRLSSAVGGAQANGGSGNPTISADGSVVLFSSWASNLTERDHNQRGDLFALALPVASLQLHSAPKITWPWMPGTAYKVLYSDSPATGPWNDLPGSVQFEGSKAWMQDDLPPPNQRFYRVLAY